MRFWASIWERVWKTPMPLTVTGEGYREFIEPAFYEAETVADVRKIRNPVDKAHALVAADDGSANLLVYKFDLSSAAADNGTTVLAPTSGVDGRWFRIPLPGSSFFGSLDSSIISVKASPYNATGDGVTDDTAAVQAAVDASPSDGTVFFPPGTYVLSGVELDKSIRITGFGTVVIKQKLNATTSLFYSDSANTFHTLRFENIELDGQQAARIAADGTLANIAWWLGCLIYTQTSYKTLICDRVIFRNHLRGAIWIHGTFEVRHCHFYGGAVHNGVALPFSGYSSYISGYAGAPNQAGLDPNVCTATIEDCVMIADSVAAGVLGSNPGGVFVSEQEFNGGSAATHNSFERISFTGNKCYGVGVSRSGNLIACFQTYNSGKSVIATGNEMYYPGVGGIICQRADDVIIAYIIVGHGPSAFSGDAGSPRGVDAGAREGSFPFTAGNGRAGERHYRCTIEGNTIFSCKQYGILAAGDHVLIRDNVINSITPSDSTVLVGINALGDYVTVENNLLLGIATNVIYCGSASLAREFTGIRVRGNTIYSNGVTTNTQLLRMVGTTAIRDCEVADNLIVDTAASTATGIGLTNAKGIRITGNRVVNSYNGYQFIAYLADACEDVTFEHNQGDTGASTGVVFGTTNIITARFNDMSGYAAQKSSTSATNYKSFSNSWDASTYDQNNVIIKPEVDSANSFEVLTSAGSVMLRADTVTPRMRHLAGVFEINTVRVPDGSTGTPSISFQSETGAGIYRSGANQISFTIASAERVRVGGSSLAVISSSSAATPSIHWLSDTNTGFYKPTDDRMGVAAGGVACGTFMSAGFVAGGETLNASAVLEGTSTTKGFLLPRMTKVQRDAIGSPANGLMIAQSDEIAGVFAREAGTWVRYVVGGDVTPVSSGPYTVLLTDFTILCDTTSAGFTVVLPSAVNTKGRIFHVKKISADGNTLTLDANAGNIDGAATQTTTTQWVGWQVISDGTDYFIL